MSGQNVRRFVLGLTLFLFVAIYGLTITAGIADARHLSSFLIASYLVLWGGYALLSSVPRQEIRSQFILTTISLGVAVLLVELPAVVKLIDYRRTFSVSGNLLGEEPGYLPDPELVAKPAPYRTVKMEFSRGNLGEVLCLPSRPAEPFELKYDKNGFRNDEDFTKADIAVIGDSYVESPMLPGSMLATTRLAELIQKTVANLGQSGYGMVRSRNWPSSNVTRFRSIPSLSSGYSTKATISEMPKNMKIKFLSSSPIGTQSTPYGTAHLQGICCPG
ncbi:MAG: hypothetical protein H8K07_09610 [Nitrospira sp.]|nr:hypothetical protein [Nitrospira sp.]